MNRLAGHPDPRVRMEVAEKLADRLEGRPIQTTELRPLRETVFYCRGDPIPPGVASPRPVAPPQAEEEMVAAEAQIAAATLETLVEADVPPPATIDGKGYARNTAH